MNKHNLTPYISINNHKSRDEAAYLCAVAHISWCMAQGYEAWQVMASVGIPAPIDASWNQALGVIWSKSMELSNKETP